MIGDDLDVATEGLVLPGVPQVVAGGGVAGGDAVGADEGPVQAHEGLSLVSEPGEGLGQVRRLGGDHVQGLVEVPVCGCG